MATVMKKVDAVIVGFGWVGAIMAKELTEAGLNVVALERGPMRDTYPDGSYPQVIDELTYNIRRKLFQDLSKSTVTIRHNSSQTAVPYRQLAAFLPGTGVGGAGLHWSGVHFRVDPIELRMRSHYEERYGKNFIPKDMTIQDFGVTYDELEPFFDKAEKVFGTSGTAWTIKGQKVAQKGGNRFAADRSSDFPLPAQKNTYSAQLFEKAALEVGYHPYNLPSANTSDSYTNPYGAQMGPCNFCGFCSGYACYMYSKASPNVNILPALRMEKRFELRTNANVLKVNLTDDKSRATGVNYVDAQGREIEQPAELVILGAFQFHNVHLMLLSGIGKPYDPVTGEGVVGRNFAYQNMTTIKAFFDKDVFTNPFIGAGGNGVGVDDFNADNFDHAKEGSGVGLRGSGQIAVEVETELRLLAPLMQVRQLLAQTVGAVGVEGFQLLILQQQEAVVAIAADAIHFRYPHAFAARQQRQLIGLGGEYRQLFTGVAFHEHLVVTVTHAPRRVNVAPGQFNPFAYLCAAKMFT